jgi:hypothetical protein
VSIDFDLFFRFCSFVTEHICLILATQRCLRVCAWRLDLYFQEISLSSFREAFVVYFFYDILIVAPFSSFMLILISYLDVFGLRYPVLVNIC